MYAPAINNIAPILSTGQQICLTHGESFHFFLNTPRNPDYHARATFEDLTNELGRDPGELLSWRKQGRTGSPKAVVLGAPLVEGKSLYQDLQKKYK